MPVYQLKHPIKNSAGEVTVSQLKLRDHTIAEDYLAFDQRGGVAQRQALIASMAGTDEALVRKLHGADYVALVAMVDKMVDAAEVEALGPDEPKTGTDGQALSEAQKK